MIHTLKRELGLFYEERLEYLQRAVRRPGAGSLVLTEVTSGR